MFLILEFYVDINKHSIILHRGTYNMIFYAREGKMDLDGFCISWFCTSCQLLLYFKHTSVPISRLSTSFLEMALRPRIVWQDSISQRGSSHPCPLSFFGDIDQGLSEPNYDIRIHCSNPNPVKWQFPWCIKVCGKPPIYTILNNRITIWYRPTGIRGKVYFIRKNKLTIILFLLLGHCILLLHT